MKAFLPTWVLFSIVFITAEVFNVYSAESAGNEPNLVIVDNDFTGPPNTLSDLRCALMFLESLNMKVLGFTVVTGDGWRDEEVAHLLRLEEIAGRTDVPERRKRRPQLPNPLLVLPLMPLRRLAQKRKPPFPVLTSRWERHLS
jgi:hypothetical protein